MTSAYQKTRHAQIRIESEKLFERGRGSLHRWQPQLLHLPSADVPNELLLSQVAVQELRKELEDRGLDSTGLKQALIDRLEAALAIPGSSIATPASSQLAKAAEPSVTHSDPAIAQANLSQGTA